MSDAEWKGELMEMRALIVAQVKSKISGTGGGGGKAGPPAKGGKGGKGGPPAKGGKGGKAGPPAKGGKAGPPDRGGGKGGKAGPPDRGGKGKGPPARGKAGKGGYEAGSGDGGEEQFWPGGKTMRKLRWDVVTKEDKIAGTVWEPDSVNDTYYVAARFWVVKCAYL